jgi:hypothetical protein
MWNLSPFLLPLLSIANHRSNRYHLAVHPPSSNTVVAHHHPLAEHPRLLLRTLHLVEEKMDQVVCLTFYMVEGRVSGRVRQRMMC